MSFNLLSAILRGPWLIDPNWAQAQLPYVKGILDGDVKISEQKENTDETKFPRVAHLGSAGTGISLAAAVQVGKYGADFSQAPENSIAIIPITGPIMKYNGECGEPGSMARASWISSASKSKNISSIICIIDTPGGQVDGTQTLADAIKEASKTMPVIGYIDDGMCASAGYWIGSACTELYASKKTDTIGSIGVFTRLLDTKGAYEAKGFKVHEIYAPQSEEKNLDYREALTGNYALIENELKFIANQFIGAVKSNRKGKLNTEEKDPFKGAMYFAEDAIKIGLIDGIKTLESTIERATELSNPENTIAQTNNNSDMNIFGKKNKAIESLKGKKAEEISNEELQAANAELQESGVEAVVLITTATHESIGTVSSELTTAQQTIESTTVAITEAGYESLEALIASHNEWKEKAIKYGADPGAEGTAPKKENSSEIDNADRKELNSWEIKAAKKNEH